MLSFGLQLAAEAYRYSLFRRSEHEYLQIAQRHHVLSFLIRLPLDADTLHLGCSAAAAAVTSTVAPFVLSCPTSGWTTGPLFSVMLPCQQCRHAPNCFQPFLQLLSFQPLSVARRPSHQPALLLPRSTHTSAYVNYYMHAHSDNQSAGSMNGSMVKQLHAHIAGG